MTNNFDLRKFLSENKTTKTSNLSEGNTDPKLVDLTKLDFNSIEVDGVDPNDAPDYADAYVDYAEYKDGTPLTDEEIDYLNDYHSAIAQEHLSGVYEEVSEEIQEEKVEEVKEETVNESREAYLTKLVENALGIDTTPVAEEANEEMVEENPLPKYKNIDELMKNIEYGTNEAAHKYKMNRMKEIADALEAKVTSLEEGENAEHIDQKAVKAMKKDIMTLRKGVEKLEKEYEKKFAKKEKKGDK